MTMREGIENGTIQKDMLNTLWKKTFGYRRLFIRSHTTNEILEKFPGYSYPELASLFKNYLFSYIFIFVGSILMIFYLRYLKK
jgi:hypothetical protein